jgi:hypothetical protein
MTHVDDIESDLSRFHRLDIWSVSFHRAMRLARKLPAYRGALWWAMEGERQATSATPQPSLSTSYPQPVDNSADGDTPPEVVAALWQKAIVSDYQDRGFQVDGIESISADEMRSMLDA